MSQEKIEFVSGYLNYNKCGCCSLAIAESDGFYQINSAHHEIFNLLFIAKNIELKLDVLCGECNEQLTSIYKFRQDVIVKLEAHQKLDLEPLLAVKIELDDENDNDLKPLSFDFIKAESPENDHNYLEPEYHESKSSKRHRKPEKDDIFLPLKKRRRKPPQEVNDGKRIGGITYNCCLCKIFTSDNKKDYANHILDIHAINNNNNLKSIKTNEDSRMRMIETRPLPEPKCSVQCDYCGSIFKTKKILYGHMKTHVSIKDQVKCIECDKVFRDMRIMIRHRNHYHGKGVKFWCYCGNEFDNSRDLNRCRYAHGRNSVPKKLNNKCDECNVHKSFSGLRQLLNHKNKYHSNGKRFWCARCGTEYDSKERQNVCIKSHYNDVLKDILVKCPECEKELLHNSLKIHLKSVHSQIREIVCHQCGKAFCAIARLTIHINQVHNNGMRPFHCDICGNCFAQKKALRDHVLKVHCKNRRKYECSICLKVCFENPERHMSVVHPNGYDNGIRVNKETNLFHCPKCIQTFSKMKAYEWHVNENLCENYGEFEIDQNQDNGKKFNVFTQGKFKCKICDSVQKTLARLRRHQHYVHSGEVNCPVCFKKMKCKRAVIGHLRKVHKTNYTAVLNATR